MCITANDCKMCIYYVMVKLKSIGPQHNYLPKRLCQNPQTSEPYQDKMFYVDYNRAFFVVTRQILLRFFQLVTRRKYVKIARYSN